jgi:hypothetical protein
MGESNAAAAQPALDANTSDLLRAMRFFAAEAFDRRSKTTARAALRADGCAPHH